MAEKRNSIVWGDLLIFILLLTGVIYTVKLRFIQFKMFPYIIKKLKNRCSPAAQFRTFCMSLGAAMGTGNITGVVSAIAIGGAGAIFWMWVSAFLGMATVCAENRLSAMFGNEHCKGPMAYIRHGLNAPKLSVIFALCCILAAFGMGGAVQINSLTESISVCTEVSPVVISGIAFLVIYPVIIGGAERICRTAQYFLPAAAVIYFLLCMTVIAYNITSIPEIFRNILSEAFGIRQAAGGFSWAALSKVLSAGIRRGIFSNEAGLGSSPILHSSANKASSSETQCYSSMLEVFTDTMLCCTLTAVTFLCCPGYNSISDIFSATIGRFTLPITAFIIAVFAFCTVIGWYYCGETAFRYVFTHRSIGLFSFIFALTAASGAFFKAQSIWIISDIFNGLMAFPNIIALILLLKYLRKE